MEYQKLPYYIPNGYKVYKNLPKFLFLSLKIYHLATLLRTEIQYISQYEIFSTGISETVPCYALWLQDAAQRVLGIFVIISPPEPSPYQPILNSLVIMYRTLRKCLGRAKYEFHNIDLCGYYVLLYPRS
jgi:hypothetical protein